MSTGYKQYDELNSTAIQAGDKVFYAKGKERGTVIKLTGPFYTVVLESGYTVVVPKLALVKVP